MALSADGGAEPSVFAVHGAALPFANADRLCRLPSWLADAGWAGLWSGLWWTAPGGRSAVTDQNDRPAS